MSHPSIGYEAKAFILDAASSSPDFACLHAVGGAMSSPLTRDAGWNANGFYHVI